MSEKIPKGWKRVKLGEVITLNYGKSLPEKKRIKGNIPVFSSAGITGWHNEALVNSKGIIIGRKGTIGRVYKSNVPFYPIDTTYYILPNEKYNFDFLYYLLLNLNLEELNEDSAVPGLNRNTVYSLEIIIPESIDEQRAIASVLSSLDDKIDLLHRQNKTLEAMAETLFRKWFIEDAKEEWEEVPLNKIYVFEKGFEPGSKNYLEEKGENTIRFIRVGDMLDSLGNVYIEKNKALKTCNENDLIMSFDGTVGRLTFGIKGAYSSGIRKIYSNDLLFDNLGLKYLLFSSKDIQDLIKSHATGSVILHASSSIKYLTFSFPEKEKIEKFNKIIMSNFAKILSNKTQIRTLEKLRDTLLPKLMSGEVRVKY